MGAPANKTIIAVIEYLDNHLGLSLYGQCRNLETGEELQSLMDYSAEDAIKLRKLIRYDQLWSRDNT